MIDSDKEWEESKTQEPGVMRRCGVEPSRLRERQKKRPEVEMRPAHWKDREWVAWTVGRDEVRGRQGPNKVGQ